MFYPIYDKFLHKSKFILTIKNCNRDLANSNMKAIFVSRIKAEYHSNLTYVNEYFNKNGWNEYNLKNIYWQSKIH